MTIHSTIHPNAKVTTETETLALRRRLAKAHRILTAGGIWPLTKGHVSARIPGTDKVLILGHIHSEGRSLIDTDVDDIVTVDLEGNWLEGRIEPVDERYLHLEIMKARPDVTSVVHAHPTYATAFGIAGRNIFPVGNRGAIFAPQVPILDFDRQIDTPERGRMARDAIGRRPRAIAQEPRRGGVRGFDRERHHCDIRIGRDGAAALDRRAAGAGRIKSRPAKCAACLQVRARKNFTATCGAITPASIRGKTTAVAERSITSLVIASAAKQSSLCG